MSVPVVATFTGVRGLPLLALAYNSVAPLLELEEDGIVSRVLRKRRRAYKEVEQVDYTRGVRGRMLRVTFRGGWLTLTANVADDRSATVAIARLRNAGCQLTSRAGTVA